MKNTAWKEGDDEIYTVEKHQQEKDWSIVMFIVLITIIALGFIFGEVIVNHVENSCEFDAVNCHLTK